jgi:hypothetical protein
MIRGKICPFFLQLAVPVLLLACNFCSILLLAQAKPDPRLKRDKLIGIEGKVTSRAGFSGTLNDSSFIGAKAIGAKAIEVAAEQPSPAGFLIPDVPPPNALSTDDVTAILDDLFKWSPAASKYGTYFLLLPGAITLKQNVAANVAAVPAGQVYLYQPYPIANKNVAIKVQAISAIQGAWPFQAANGDPADADFVLLDGFAKLVPVPVADSMEANFINGLVTRLILGEYARAWKANGASIDASGLSFTGLISTPQFPDMTAVGSYPANVTFDAAIATLLQSNPVQPAGLLWGWKAGDDLDALVGTGNEKYRNDVWRLVRGRFTSEDMGRMVAFTLNYLTGFIKNDRIVQIAATNTDQPRLNTTDIFNRLSQDTGVNFARTLLSQFHSSLVGQFYSLSQNAKLSNNDKSDSLARVAGLIRGFETGSIEAADQVYIDVFQLAYGLGYKDGFRDGYAQGYAAGYRAGYAAGYAQAWKEANVVIQRLQQELNDAKSQNSFWGTLGTVASVVGTVLSFL